jgi:hypothetical protein
MSGIVALSISACAPPLPEPTPSATVSGFASEEEAFRAAEATYRAYIDALNEVDLDPTSEIDPLRYLAGPALAAERSGRATFDELGVHLRGPMKVVSVSRGTSDLVTARLTVCVDVARARLLDDSGKDVTPRERGVLVGLDITVEWRPTQPVIIDSTANETSCS